MIKVETGTNLIARYDYVIPEDFCDRIIQYIRTEKPLIKTVTVGYPWNNNDNISFASIADKNVRAIVDSYRFLFTQMVGNHYDKIVYPHFCDLVVWRKGMSMPFHKDDGYANKEYFSARKYSMVAYLNDNYIGGETIIKYEDKEYVSIPKKGSIVFFKSNEECLHCVNRIESGIRYTLANWFTEDLNSCDVLDKY